MYTTLETKKTVGRPKREDQSERASLKLNVAIRKLLKISSIMDGRTESAQIERLVVESEALKRILKADADLASRLLPRLNAETANILSELQENQGND